MRLRWMRLLAYFGLAQRPLTASEERQAMWASAVEAWTSTTSDGADWVEWYCEALSAGRIRTRPTFTGRWFVVQSIRGVPMQVENWGFA